MNIYIASSLKNSTRAREIMAICHDNGHKVTYDWTQHGQVFEAEDLERIGHLERDGVKYCDLLIMIHPAEYGSHVELGMAIAYEKKIFILEDQPPKQLKPFYFLPGIERFQNLDSLLHRLKDHDGHEH